MVLCGCSVSWLVACIGLPGTNAFWVWLPAGDLFSWCWCCKWEGPFISCLSYPKSLGGANTGDFKDPTALSEKSRGISLVLVACRSYICTTDLDKFPADEDWATLWKCCCVCHCYLLLYPKFHGSKLNGSNHKYSKDNFLTPKKICNTIPSAAPLSFPSLALPYVKPSWGSVKHRLKGLPSWDWNQNN